MFLPTTRAEMTQLGWEEADVIIVTGDSYIDSPFIGAAVIGKILHQAGYRVGIIAQPDITSPADITRLGEPRLFWGVTGGSVDSMVANYTSLKKKRRSDDYTPGGLNTRRPDRAAIKYTNLIRQYFKGTAPIVLGGMEASLRRVAHYDYWDDRIRGSVLIDAKADYLIYGMGEKAITELAGALASKSAVKSIRGLCRVANEAEINELRGEYLELPSLEQVVASGDSFTTMFKQFYVNNDPITAKGLFQKHDTRYLVQNPPALPLSQAELDDVYAMPYERAQHPYYQRLGKAKALETIKFSIQTHRGCYGECNFCAIAVHEGRTVQWRSEASILAEARRLTEYTDFTGYIRDIGGPTANMYGFECAQKLKRGACADKRCLSPGVCPTLKADHSRQISLLNKLRRIDGVKKVFVASGIRYDMVLSDKQHGEPYLKEVIRHHVSGQMKVAPEHSEPRILKAMGKPGIESLLKFKAEFDRISANAGKKQFLTYYLIAAHPGCTAADMRKLKQFISRNLRINPEQVQIFLPAPSTWSSVMYHTGKDPFTGKPIFVEKDLKNKEGQKEIVTGRDAPHQPPKRATKTTDRSFVRKH
ncbi:MAG: YgiQ family radical SAM protein [Dehalogenimonas sp.]|uniref:YgiQ family radical SAM protein n=1 Tax=Candidatus Dehalogenimonas loeffleri TaxID=3127115 RepID=A0ABZ2J2V3_9CHLR|nr:YgiQ family radical SAM protein [Dehalogenimonas sp.]